MKKRIFRLLYLLFLVSFDPVSGAAQDCNAHFTYTYSTESALTVDFASVLEGDAADVIYDWTIDGMGTSIDNGFIHTFADPGTYEVCLSVSVPLGETCETCTDICVLAPDASSVSESGFIQSEMDIYPNPAEDQITISFTPSGHIRTGAEACLTVWDIMGGPVLIRNISIVSGLNTFQLNIKNLVPGTYGIEVKAGNQSGHAKFVKR